MALLAIGGSIIGAAVALLIDVVSVAGYAALAGGVISVISQIMVVDEVNPEHVFSYLLSIAIDVQADSYISTF